MALGPIAINADHLFIRIEKFSSLQTIVVSLATFLVYIYSLNGNVVCSDTCMQCLINGQEFNFGYA
jgi:hypothetical protein